MNYIIKYRLNGKLHKRSVAMIPARINQVQAEIRAMGGIIEY